MFDFPSKVRDAYWQFSMSFQLFKFSLFIDGANTNVCIEEHMILFTQCFDKVTKITMTTCLQMAFLKYNPNDDNN